MASRVILSNFEFFEFRITHNTFRDCLVQFFPRTFLETGLHTPGQLLLVSFFQDPKELCLEKNIRNSKEFITCFCIPIVGLRQTDRYPPTLAEDTDEWPRLINVGTEQNKERKTESRLGAR